MRMPLLLGQRVAKPAFRKRKSDANEKDDIKAIMFPADAPEIDEYDSRLELISDLCQQTRRKVRNWIESGAMKVGEFQKELGISSKSYGNFMNRTKTWDGEGCDMYVLAARSFKKRELQGLPLSVLKSKKAKTAAPAAAGSSAKGSSSTSKATQEQLLDVSGITLPGEDNMTVPVFDTCEQARKKLRALMAKGVTQAALARTLTSMFPEGSGKNVSPAVLRSFMGQKETMSGNTSAAFCASWVFFEKRRLKEGKPKSEFRLIMEGVHPGLGVDTERSMSGPVLCMAGSRPVIDKYGMVSVVREW